MIDTSSLRASVDLLALASRDTTLLRVASTGGGEWAGPCPFCGGRDRFRIQPYYPEGGRWLCRFCTSAKWQDVIAYTMRREQCDFRSACKLLGSAESLPAMPKRLAPQPERHLGPPPMLWQEQARKNIAECEATLWTGVGIKAREWLNDRGFKNETLRRWDIGFNPADRFEPLSKWGLPDPLDGKRHAVYLPCGVVIPCEAGGIVRYLKVRLLPGVPFRCIGCWRSLTEPGKCPHCNVDNRYRHVNGGNSGLFGCDTLPGHDVAVFCEGEFDVMLLDQEAGDLAGAVTLGSASGRLDLKEWIRYLLPVASFLLAYDADKAGENGADALVSISARMHQVRVPKLNPRDKDVTDYYKAGGNLRDWVKFLISQYGGGG